MNQAVLNVIAEMETVFEKAGRTSRLRIFTMRWFPLTTMPEIRFPLSASGTTGTG